MNSANTPYRPYPDITRRRTCRHSIGQLLAAQWPTPTSRDYTYVGGNWSYGAMQLRRGQWNDTREHRPSDWELAGTVNAPKKWYITHLQEVCKARQNHPCIAHERVDVKFAGRCFGWRLVHGRTRQLDRGISGRPRILGSRCASRSPATSTFLPGTGTNAFPWVNSSQDADTNLTGLQELGIRHHGTSGRAVVSQATDTWPNSNSVKLVTCAGGRTRADRPDWDLGPERRSPSPSGWNSFGAGCFRCRPYYLALLTKFATDYATTNSV